LIESSSGLCSKAFSALRRASVAPRPISRGFPQSPVLRFVDVVTGCLRFSCAPLDPVRSLEVPLSRADSVSIGTTTWFRISCWFCDALATEAPTSRAGSRSAGTTTRFRTRCAPLDVTSIGAPFSRAGSRSTGTTTWFWASCVPAGARPSGGGGLSLILGIGRGNG
jgi:hypothetical protein